MKKTNLFKVTYTKKEKLENFFKNIFPIILIIIIFIIGIFFGIFKTFGIYELLNIFF